MAAASSAHSQSLGVQPTTGITYSTKTKIVLTLFVISILNAAVLVIAASLADGNLSDGFKILGDHADLTCEIGITGSIIIIAFTILGYKAFTKCKAKTDETLSTVPSQVATPSPLPSAHALTLAPELQATTSKHDDMRRKKAEQENIRRKKREEARSELQGTMVISEEVTEQIQKILSSSFQEATGMAILSTDGRNIVFSLESAPGLIFKNGKNEDINNRYETMVSAKAVCREHQLDLIVIPSAQLITFNVEGKEFVVVVESKLDFVRDDDVLEENYYNSGATLDEAIRQMAILICEIGLTDVNWRNNPVLATPDSRGNRKIAAFDFEETRGAAMGLRQLLKCINERQIDIVRRIGEQYHAIDHHFASDCTERLKRLHYMRNQDEYYARKHITRGDESIEVDLASIDFSSYTDETADKLRRLTQNVVNKIKEELLQRTFRTKRRHRQIQLQYNAPYGPDREFYGCNHKPIDEKPNRLAPDLQYRFVAHDFGAEASFLGFVVKKLIERDLIFGLVRTAGSHGFFIDV